MLRIHDTAWLLALVLVLGLGSEGAAETFSLTQCLDRAFAQSKRIQSEQAKVDQAEAKVKEAFGEMLPKVNVTATYTYTPWLPRSVFAIDVPEGMAADETAQDDTPAEDDSEGDGAEEGEGGFALPADPIEVEFGAPHNGLVAANLEQPLFTWGKLSNNLDQSKASLEAARQGFEAARQQLQLEITQAFYGVLLAQDFVEVSQRALEQIEKHEKLAEILVETGAATKLDLIRAQVQLANVKSQRIRAGNGLELATENLKLLLSMSPDEMIQVEGAFEVRSLDLELSSLIEQALQQRPDLAQLHHQELAGEKFVRIAKAGNKPNLAFVSNYQYARTNRQTSGNHGFSVTLALSIPVFDGFKTKAQSKQAELGLQQIELGRAQLEDAIRLQVKAAYLDVYQAKALLEAQQETVSQAKEGLRIANIQYENGMITSVGLTDAELGLTQAEVNRIQALHDHVVAQAELENAIGGSLQ